MRLTGKTILASVVIEACLNTAVNNPSNSLGFCTAYFYCKEEEHRKNDCISVFRALLSQLLCECPQLVPYCYERYAFSFRHSETCFVNNVIRMSTSEVVLTSTTVADALLKLFLELLPKVVIIVDGLDELDISQRKLLLSLLNTHVEYWDEHEPGKLRIMFISQQLADIDKALRTAARLSLTPKDNENDIKVVVKFWCEMIRPHYELESDVADYIHESTCARSEGTFYGLASTFLSFCF